MVTFRVMHMTSSVAHRVAGGGGGAWRPLFFVRVGGRTGGGWFDTLAVALFSAVPSADEAELPQEEEFDIPT